jgi:hypothetical protein
MKIANDEIAGLLVKKPTTRTETLPEKAPKVRQVRSGREVARVNELKCVKAVAQFGHLRIVELARCVWPVARYGEQLARRTVARMVAQGLLLARRNALGSKSLCLTRGGAAWLDARGIQAQHTLDLSSVAGPTFYHRTQASRYLLERQVAGYQVAGEYQILRRKLPFSIEGLAKALRKLPDGLVWQRKSDGTVAVEIVEQEAAAKARSELEKCLKAAEYVGTSLSKDGTAKIAGLVFVYDRSLNHARRILLAANSLWGGRTVAERATLESRVKLVAVELREPLVWVSSSVMTLHEFRVRGV